MAWTTPITAVANSTFQASQWNSSVRDNLAVQAPAISTTNGRLIVSNGVNTVAEREIAQSIDDANVSTSSTTFVTLGGGPAVTITTGIGCLVFVSSNIGIATNNTGLYGPSFNGDTPASGRCIMQDGDGTVTRDDRLGVTVGFMTLTPGSQTITLQARVTGGGPVSMQKRRIIGMAL